MPQLEELRLELTQICNLNCRYCYVNACRANQSGAKKAKELSLAEIKILIRDAARGGLKIVSLTGGEPFLKAGLLEEIVSFASDMGLQTGTLTNGTVCSNDDVKNLRERGLAWLRVSLDGSSEETNFSCRGRADFADIIRTLRASKKAGLKSIVRTTVTSKNAHDMKGMIRLAEKLSVDRLDIQPLFPVNSEKIDDEFMLKLKDHMKVASQLLVLRRAMKPKVDVVLYSNWFEFLLPEYGGEPVYESKCGRSFCLVDAYGNVKSCGPNLKVAGNIRKSSILEIWENSMHFKQIRKNERFGICKTCDKSDLCVTCPAATYNLYRNINHPSPLCPKVRESEYGNYP